MLTVTEERPQSSLGHGRLKNSGVSPSGMAPVLGTGIM